MTRCSEYLSTTGTVDSWTSRIVPVVVTEFPVPLILEETVLLFSSFFPPPRVGHRFTGLWSIFSYWIFPFFLLKPGRIFIILNKYTWMEVYVSYLTWEKIPYFPVDFKTNVSKGLVPLLHYRGDKGKVRSSPPRRPDKTVNPPSIPYTDRKVNP